MAEYIEKTEKGDLRHCEVRPTQAEIKERGLGTTWLYRMDGSLAKTYVVEETRTGGRKIKADPPKDLEGISTLNLQRMQRAYDKIVKHWPAQRTAQRKIVTELETRETLLSDLAKLTKVKGKRVETAA